MNQKVWFKFYLSVFYDPKFKIMETYEERDLLFYVMVRCFDLAAVTDDHGDLYINKNMPYSVKTLAVEFNRPYEQIAFAIKILRKLEILILKENKILCVKNWDKYQEVPDKSEKERIQRNLRVAKHRAKKRSELDGEADIENNVSNNIEEVKSDSLEGKLVCNESENIDNEKNELNNIDDNIVVKDNLESVTCNEPVENDVTVSNVTVTEKKENKKKTKNKRKNNKEKDIDTNIDTEDVSLVKFSDKYELAKDEKVVKSFSFNDNESKEIDNRNQHIKKEPVEESATKNSSVWDDELNQSCVRMSEYYEKLTGIVGSLNISSLKMLIDTHGEKYVKMAIEKAVEQGKTTIMYINGILRNWAHDGYPEDEERVRKDGGKPKCNKESNEADTGFKAPKRRKLTEAEKRRLEEKYAND